MADQFVAEIRITGFNFAPTGWAQCDGQLLSVAQNTALFSLLGTNYGGNGQSNFGLPNLQGQFPMHWDQGQGLSYRQIGESGGSDTVTLLESEIPAHNHVVYTGSPATPTASPQGALLGAAPTRPFKGTSDSGASMHPQAIGITGGGMPHNNLPPYLVMNFIIALQGIFPSRN